MSIGIAAGQWTITLEEAKSALAGYAFGVRAVGDEMAPRWGYRTYDCVPASPGPDFSNLDILVAAGLNGQLDVDAIGALQIATRRAAPYLAQAADRRQAFCELTLAELSDSPQAGTEGWLLTQAWQQMMKTPDVGRALTHKVLHHKRPTLFPLLDRKTAGPLHAGQPHGQNAWQVIWTDIDSSRAEFEELRTWFVRLAASRNSQSLGLLRIHDILLWLHAADQWRAVVAAADELPATLSVTDLSTGPAWRTASRHDHLGTAES
jgi:hypothetical protein